MNRFVVVAFCIAALSLQCRVVLASDIVDRLKAQPVNAFDLGMFILERDLISYINSDSFFFARSKPTDIIYNGFTAYNPFTGRITLAVTANRHPLSSAPWDMRSDCGEAIDRIRIWAGYDPIEQRFFRDRSKPMEVFYALVDGSHNSEAWQGDVGHLVSIKFFGSLPSANIECTGDLMSSEYSVRR